MINNGSILDNPLERVEQILGEETDINLRPKDLSVLVDRINNILTEELVKENENLRQTMKEWERIYAP